MGVIFKHTLKNMFSKPFRTIMLVLCILICSFAAMMTFDMSNSVRNVLESAFLTMFGDSNVMVTGNGGLKDADFEGLPEHDKALMTADMTTFNIPGNTEYAYFHEKSILIYTTDIEDANTLHLLAEETELARNEIAIPKTLSEDLKLKKGDKIEFFDENDQPHEYTVKAVLSYKGLLSEKYNVVMPLDGFRDLFGEEITFKGAYVRVHDRSKVGEFCDLMQEKTQGVEPEDLINGELVQQNVNGVTSVFAILFLICLMLVIFVTISLSERIMVERMGTVGTLRSLGVTPNTTAKIVLFENALYGLIGGAIGSTLYVLTRDAIFNNVFSLNSGSDIELEMNLGKVSVAAWIGVIIGAIVIECLCPIKELLKATRTSIRDLIFDNKDADYKYARKTLVAAILFTIAGGVCLSLVLTKTMESLGFICDTIRFSGGSAVYVVSLNTYNEIFEDHPVRAYIRTTDPEGTIATIKEESFSMFDTCQTMDEYMEDIKNSNAGMNTILYMLIGMGVLLTFIAVVSNQIIGFSGRRRECAVLASTAMNRGKLKKAFLAENFFSCILAMAVAVPFSAVIAGLFNKAMVMIEMNFGLSIDVPSTMIFLGALFLLFLSTVLMPVKNIRKMKIAEQLKYE